MNVKIYSMMAVGALIRNGFPENVSVISFYSPSRGKNPNKMRIDYSNVCNEVFYVGVPDITEEGFKEYGYTDIQEQSRSLRLYVHNPLHQW